MLTFRVLEMAKEVPAGNRILDSVAYVSMVASGTNAALGGVWGRRLWRGRRGGNRIRSLQALEICQRADRGKSPIDEVVLQIPEMGHG